jgi:hypothetical protein
MKSTRIALLGAFVSLGAVNLSDGSPVRAETSSLLPVLSGGAFEPKVDMRAVALLAKVEGRYAKAKSITADLTMRNFSDKNEPSRTWTSTHITLQRPLLIRETAVRASDTISDTIQAGYDGKMSWQYHDRDTAYYSSMGFTRSYGSVQLPPPLAMFFPAGLDGEGPNWESDRAKDLSLRTLTYMGKHTWNGKEVERIDWEYVSGHLRSGDEMITTARLYVSGDVLTGVEVMGETGGRMEYLVRSVKFDATLPALAFAPPTKLPALTYNYGLAEASMVGKPAPRFRFATASGDTVTIDQLCAGKKALMLNSWYLHNRRSTESTLKQERLYRELKDKGLAALSVNMEDPPDFLNRFAKDNGTTVPMALDQDMMMIEMYKLDYHGAVVIIDATTQRIEYAGPSDYKKITEVLAKLGVK